jgi:hypothetical protein
MSKKPDYSLEYVFRKSTFRKSMWTYLGVWLALRVLRAVLYFTVGITFLSSIPAAFIFWASGMVVGLAVMTIYVYRRSIRVDDLETEVSRLKQ